jgi:transcription initiation factor TFIIIB Brf1 subunit/transcription initiation factor TFIIB
MDEFMEFNNICNTSDEKECKHLNTTIEKDIEICEDCGQELTLNSEGNSIKFVSDIHNIQARKDHDRTIFNDVASLNFGEDIVNRANDIYTKVTGNQIYRGKTRRSIIFACVFYSFTQTDRPQTYEKLLKLFGITKKIGSKGIKLVNLQSPKDILKKKNITPCIIITELMTKFNANDKQIKEVLDLYEKIKNRSTELNRCRPQSMANALVYYWLTEKGTTDLTLSKFLENIELSEMTINKIIKIIKNIL